MSDFKTRLETEKVELKEKLNKLDAFKEIEKAIFKIQDQQSHDLVMVTLSENGIMLSDGQEIFRIPAHYRSIADVSGAGDRVISVAALCLAQQLDKRTIAALSNLAGGLVCEHVGVVPVNKEQFLTEAKRLL